jgi:hypothetical protein
MQSGPRCMVHRKILMVSDAGRRPKQDTIKIGLWTILSAPQCRTLIWDPYFHLGAALIRSMTPYLVASTFVDRVQRPYTVVVGTPFTHEEIDS